MAASKEIVKIMDSMGWTDGSFIPIASEENKLLIKAMAKWQVDKEKRTVDHQELAQRIGKLSDHLGHAKNDIVQNLVRRKEYQGVIRRYSSLPSISVYILRCHIV